MLVALVRREIGERATTTAEAAETTQRLFDQINIRCHSAEEFARRCSRSACDSHHGCNSTGRYRAACHAPEPEVLIAGERHSGTTYVKLLLASRLCFREATRSTELAVWARAGGSTTCSTRPASRGR